MSLFKKKKTESSYDRLLQISYNYDVVYEENSTDSEIMPR